MFCIKVSTNDHSIITDYTKDQFYQDQDFLKPDIVNYVFEKELEEELDANSMIEKEDLIYCENGNVLSIYIFDYHVNREGFVSIGTIIDLTKKYLYYNEYRDIIWILPFEKIDLNDETIEKEFEIKSLKKYLGQLVFLSGFCKWIIDANEIFLSFKISSAFEMSYLIKIFYHYFICVDNKQFELVKANYDLEEIIKSNSNSKIVWPCFNLPPGFGKTFQLQNLLQQSDIMVGIHDRALLSNNYNSDKLKVLKKSLQICCPTAKASLLYDNAKTIHSHFKIDFRKNEHTLKLNNIGSEKPMFIFDEYSMISDSLIKIVIRDCLISPWRFATFSGDSAQMRPPKAKLIKFEKLLAIKNHEFINDKIRVVEFTPETNSAFIRIPRFKNSLPLQEMIMYMKKIIDNSSSCTDYDYVPTYNLTSSELKELISKMAIFEISKTKIQREQLVKLSVDKQKINFDAIRDPNNISISKFETPQCIVGYTNKYCNTIQNEINTKCMEDFYEVNNNNLKIYIEGQLLNKTEDEILRDKSLVVPHLTIANKCLNFESEENNTRIYTISEQYKSQMTKELKGLPGTIGQSDAIIKVGTYVICRRNTLDTFNGEIGLVTGITIYFKQRETFERMKTTRSLVNLGFDNFIEILPVNKTDDVNVVYSIYSFNKQTIKSLNATKYTQCLTCSAENCRHDKKVGDELKIMYWHPNYALTIYCLQGVTILDDKIVCETAETLRTDKLRTAYTILSRVVDPKLIVIDKWFILELLKSMFSRSVVDKKSFSSKEVSLKVNQFLDEIVG